jgi:hypothetical protein
MADVQVTCINKPDRNRTVDAITYLGGPSWKWTRMQVVQSIEAKTNSFYTSVNGKRADIGMRVSANGNKYVQTYADGRWTNNLLALPECA